MDLRDIKITYDNDKNIIAVKYSGDDIVQWKEIQKNYTLVEIADMVDGYTNEAIICHLEKLQGELKNLLNIIKDIPQRANPREFSRLIKETIFQSLKNFK